MRNGRELNARFVLIKVNFQKIGRDNERFKRFRQL